MTDSRHPSRIRVAVWRCVRRARGFFQQFRIRHSVRSADATLSADPPSNQQAVDIFKGTWTSAFPAPYDIQAGDVSSFDDARVRWAASVLPGGFRELTILELGPYEGYTAWQLERLGAKAVVSIEANDLSYLKSLVVKEVTGVRGRLLYGDFDRYLDACTERFDLVWASGVLYHSIDPLRLIRRIARVTDAVFVHTHYFLEESAAKSAHRYSFFEPTRDRTVPIGDRWATLHYKAYGQLKRRDFVGGAADYAYWLEKEDLFVALRDSGFNDIQLGTDDPGNPNGPALFLLARKIPGG